MGLDPQQIGLALSFSGLAGPAPGSYLADILSSNGLTNGVGVYRLVGDAGATIAPLFLGWITDRGGVGSNLWVSILALLVAICPVCWVCSG